MNLTGVHYRQSGSFGCPNEEGMTNGAYESALLVKGFQGGTQKKLNANPLPQTVDFSANPIKTGGKNTNATFEVENVVNEQVSIIGFLGPGKSITNQQKCTAAPLAKKGDKCKEEIKCVAPLGEDGNLAVVTSPPGGAMVVLKGC